LVSVSAWIGLFLNSCLPNLICFRFGRKRSSFGPSHSSGVMSFCIQNLPTALR
jgi:hypothetical protein